MTPPARRLVHTTAMGLRDTAKKVAEQAQAKLDEAQERVRARREGRAEPGEHDRSVPQAPPATATPPQGDPLTPAGEPAATTGPVPDPSAPPPPAPPERPQGDPLAD
jgi:hypothetical protein